MKLTASPFNPETGELLPVYRDAYLRGDLSKASARAVEEYLRRDSDEAHSTISRWQQLQDEAEAAPSWVGRQITLIREQPQRFRRRAATLVAGAALLGGAVFAGTNLPTDNLPNGIEMAVEPAASEATHSLAMVTVRGRIVGEDGQPLVGATVMPKGGRYAVATDADGRYSLPVSAAHSTLVYGYGGYADKELRVKEATSSANVTLKPRDKQHRWLFF